MADLVAIEDVAQEIEESGVTGVTGVQAHEYAASEVTRPENSEVTGVTQGVPSLEQRPCWLVFDDWLEAEGRKLRPGVYHFGVKERGDAPSLLTESWVCTPVHVLAVTSDAQGNNFGRLLRFRTTTGHWREWAMPMDLLRGSGDDLRGELLSMGVEIDPRNRQMLGMYLQARAPKRKVRCALEVGWAGQAFVLPDAVIGPEASAVIFQSGERGVAEYATAGSLKAWRERIPRMAEGNALFVLALSVGFAGPLLGKCHAEGGGLHLVGDSSCGKTTLAQAVASIWGGPHFKRSWRATANGIEGAAALFNDNLLVLDEISEADPREIGMIAYALTNGTGKQRAGRTGTARSVRHWRCIILSTGERTLATAMQEGGHRAKAGQAVRLLDVPVKREHGAWDDLHGMADGRAFSDAIKTAATEHHGHAGREFLERLTRDRRDFAGYLEGFKTLREFTPDGAEGQEKRAASRFALIAMAGELATEYGLTGWAEGAAIDAAAEGLRLWRGMRGRGNDERRQIIERLAAFIDKHGDARFASLAEPEAGPMVRDRAGWWKQDGDDRLYLFTADGMREALKGFDFAAALDVIEGAGIIPKAGADGKRTSPTRVDGRTVRLYQVRASKLEG